MKTDRKELFLLVCPSCDVDVHLLKDLMTLIDQTEKTSNCVFVEQWKGVEHTKLPSLP